MVLINSSSLFTQVFLNYTTYVFGYNIITCLMFMLLFLIIGSLVKLPLAINLALYIPISIILMSIGFLPILAGTMLVVLLMILTGVTLVNSI